MTTQPDFDALARRASESGMAMLEMTALFRHVFALPAWHFVARGTPPNLHPYIASNAAYADGKNMVRAFTDTDRLLRFARENRLTDTTGGAPVLSIPTKTVVAYLEGYVASGAVGVWFNSDSGSEGFFGPIPQLREIEQLVTRSN